MNTELSRRLEAVLDRAADARIGGVARIHGNPLGVERRRFGRLTATLVRRPVLYYGYYNAIRGCGSLDGADELEAAIQWFRSEKASARLTLSPILADQALMGTLSRLGLRQGASMSVLCGPAAASVTYS